MSQFVEECRREWKRLGVPDHVANEMAADLEVDLAEAEAEGTSAEDVLGVEVFDAPAFARSWATARGVIPERQAPPAAPSRVRRWYPVAGIAVCLLVAIFGVVLLVAQPAPRVTIASPAVRIRYLTIPPRMRKHGLVIPRIHVLKPALDAPPFSPNRAIVVSPGADPGRALDIAGALFLVLGLVGAAAFTAVLVVRRRHDPPAAVA